MANKTKTKTKIFRITMQVFSVGAEPSDNIEPVIDSAQLKRFAEEAEVNEDYEMASKYYQV